MRLLLGIGLATAGVVTAAAVATYLEQPPAGWYRETAGLVSPPVAEVPRAACVVEDDPFGKPGIPRPSLLTEGDAPVRDGEYARAATRLGSNHAIAREQLDRIIAEATAATGLEHQLIYAVVRTESDYRPAVVSRVGAVGLMQVRPMAAADVASRIPELQERLQREEIGPEVLADPRLNVLLGSHYLAHLHAHYARYGEPMQLWLALAAYNWGVGNVHRQITSNPNLRTLEDLRWLLYRHAPNETRAFIHRVLHRSGLAGEMT